MRTLIAIPVYNEEKYVTRVLGEIRKYATEILVIDDGSTDQTPLLLAQQPVDVIRHARNRGYGRSLIDAFRWATCTTCRYDWVITMDCDEQHEPANLPAFFEAMERGDADIISGSRYLTGDDGSTLLPQREGWEEGRASVVAADAMSHAGTTTIGSPPSPDVSLPGRGINATAADHLPAIGSPPADRRAINATITELVNHTLGLHLTDAFCGYKAYRTCALKKLSLDESGYAFPLQFWVQAAAQGLRISEIPVRLIYNDPNRSFGGPLDDAAIRLQHYCEVFRRELAKFPRRFEAACCTKSRLP